MMRIIGIFMATVAVWSGLPVDCSANEDPLEYREHLVPEADLRDYIDGMLPMSRQEFEQLSGRAQRNTVADTETTFVRQAEYRARFDDGQFVGGTAALQVRRPGGDARMCELFPCRLALARVRWSDTQLVPLIEGNDESARFVFLADREADLLFDWSLRGESQAGSQTLFRFELPASPVTRLILELPRGLEVVSPAAIIRPIGNDELSDESLPVSAEFEAWLVEMGATSRFEVTVQPRLEESSETIAEQQLRLHYQLTPAGVEINGRLQVRIDRPLTMLQIETDPSLEVATARWGEEAVEIQSSPKDESGLMFFFPKPLAPGRREIQFTALAPIQLGQLWQLPSLRCVGHPTQQLQFVLDIPDTFELRRMVTDGVIERGVDPLPSPGKGESRRFQALSPAARLAVQLAYREPRVTVSTGSTIRIGEGTMTALQISELTADRGEQFLFDLLSGRDWIIDRIETDPPTSFESRRTTTEQRERIRIRLADPLRPDQPIRVFIHAHRPMGGRKRFVVREFRPARLLSVESEQRTIALQPDIPANLVFTNDAALERITLEQLTDQERSLLDTPSGAAFFRDSWSAAGAAVRLQQQQPIYSARIHSHAVVDGSVLTQQYRVRCEPDIGAVSQVLVHLSRRGASPIQWDVVGVEDGIISARPLESSSADASGETWEINLRRGLSAPFEILGTQRVSFEVSAPLSLVSAPGSDSQTATLSVAAADGSILVVDGDTLKAIPPPELGAAPFPTPTIHYRYDPSSDAQLALRRVSAKRPSAAWIWHCGLTSQFERSGKSQHEATLRIENLGAQQIRVSFPRPVEIEKLFVNDVQVALPSGTTLRETITVPLPRELRHTTLRLLYRDTSSPLRAISHLSAPEPTFDVPCLHSTWNLWLAPGFVLSDPLSQGQLSWDERLFGISVFRREGRPFDPTLKSSWQRIADRMESMQELPRRADLALQLLRDTQREYPDANWGELLTQFSNTLATQSGQLLINATALEAIGLTATSPVRVLGYRGDLPSSADWLARDRLALVIFSDGVLLTSQADLVSLETSLIGTRHSNVMLSPSTHHVVSGNDDREITRLLTAKQWSRWTSATIPLWRQLQRARSTGVGWSHSQTEFATGRLPRVRIVHRAALRSTAWALVAIAAAGAVWCARRRRSLLPGLLLGLGAGTLVIPLEFLLPMRGLFLGCLLGTGYAFVVPPTRRRRESDDYRPESSSVFSYWSRASAGVVLLVLGAAGATTLAQEPTESGELPLPVYVPVDEQLQPSGDYVYVPPAIYDNLYRRSARGPLKTRNWLFHSADYQLDQFADRDNESVPPTLRGIWEISTYQPQTSVIIPVDRQQLRFLQLELGGRAMPWKWTDGGLELVFAMASRHRITMTCRPVVDRSNPTVDVLQVAIPPVSQTTLHVSGERSHDIEIPGSVGAIDRSKVEETGANALSANLGPVSDIQIELPKLANDTPFRISSNSLLWLQAQYDAVAVDALIKCRVQFGETRKLRVLAHPQMELQQTDLDPLIRQVTVHETDRDNPRWRALDLELAQPAFSGSSITVSLRFTLPGQSGVGPIPLPRIRLEDSSETSTEWFALSAARWLEPRLENDDLMEPLAVSEFVEAWGSTRSPPTIAFAVNAASEGGMVHVRPRTIPVDVSQQLFVHVARDECQVEFRADVTTGDSRRLHQEIDVPAGFQVDEVAVQGFGSTRLLRWNRVSSELLTVFFDEPLSGTGEILVRGWIRFPREGEALLPILHLRETNVTSNVVHLYRQPDVLIELPSQITDKETPLPAPEVFSLPPGRSSPAKIDRLARHVATFPLDSESVQLQIGINRPRVTGRMVQEFWYGDDRWHTAVDIDVQVQTGVVDYLRLVLQPEWELLKITPTMPYSIESDVGSSRRTLIMKPKSPARQRLRIRVTGELQTLSGQQFGISPASLPDLAVQRFLLLPNQVDDQQLAWDVSGMVVARPPANYENEQLPPDQSIAYRVTTATPRANVRDVQRVDRMPEVYLADYFVSWKRDGSTTGIATFDVEPGRQRYCVLALPPEHELVQVRVSGLPALMQNVGENRWQVRLVPDQMPQRLEVMFMGMVRQPTRVGPSTLTAPWLVDLPVRRTLWSLEGATSSSTVRPLLSHSEVKWQEQERIRQESIRLMLGSASTVAARSTPDEIHVWRSLVTRDGRENSSGRETVSTIPTADDTRLDSNDPRDMVATWLSYPQRGRMLHCAVRGDAPSFIVFSNHPIFRRGMTASVFALFTLGVLTVVWRARRSARLREYAAHYPYAIGVVISLACWWLMTPSMLGLLGAVIVLAGALRPSWRYQR